MIVFRKMKNFFSFFDKCFFRCQKQMFSTFQNFFSPIEVIMILKSPISPRRTLFLVRVGKVLLHQQKYYSEPYFFLAEKQGHFSHKRILLKRKRSFAFVFAEIPTSENCSGNSRSTSQACVPMDPVAPKRSTFIFSPALYFERHNDVRQSFFSLRTHGNRTQFFSKLQQDFWIFEN